MRSGWHTREKNLRLSTTTTTYSAHAKKIGFIIFWGVAVHTSSTSWMLWRECSFWQLRDSLGFSLPLHFLNSGKKNSQGDLCSIRDEKFREKVEQRGGIARQTQDLSPGRAVEPFLCQTGHIFPRNQLEIRESRKTRGEEERFTKG